MTEERPYDPSLYTMIDIRRAFIPTSSGLTPEQLEHLRIHGWVNLSPGQVSKNKRRGGKARAAQPHAAMTVRHK